MYPPVKRTAVKHCLRTAGIVLAATFTVHAGANSFSVEPDTTGGVGKYKWSIGIDGADGVGNPNFTLLTGQTYTFDVSTVPLHPFWIETAPGLGGTSPYAGGGLSDNGVSGTTTIPLAVPANAPATLYYACGNHAEMKGTISVIVDPIFQNDFEVPQM